MASCLLSFDSFDIHADGAIAQRWRKWIKRLENLFVAADIKDKTRQSAFLLYYAEEEVCDIFETLPQSGDDFETAKEKLTEYFDPEKNVEYETCNFQQAKQNPWWIDECLSLSLGDVGLLTSIRKLSRK